MQKIQAGPTIAPKLYGLAYILSREPYELPKIGNSGTTISSGKMAPPKPHAVVIPYPAQGHVTPLLHLAKVLHSRGFCITYINTVYNHQRLLRSRGADALDGVRDFHFEAIPDGLPPSNNDDVTQSIPELCISTRENCVAPFRDLVMKINLSMDAPPVSCIIADGFMTFTLEVAKELGIPELLFSTTSACGYMGYLHFFELVERGYTPLKGTYAPLFYRARQFRSKTRDIFRDKFCKKGRKYVRVYLDNLARYLGYKTGFSSIVAYKVWSSSCKPNLF